MVALFLPVLLLLLRLTAPVSGACQDLAASDHYVTAGEQKMTSKWTNKRALCYKYWPANEQLTNSNWPVCCNYEQGICSEKGVLRLADVYIEIYQSACKCISDATYWVYSHFWKPCSSWSQLALHFILLPSRTPIIFISCSPSSALQPSDTVLLEKEVVALANEQGHLGALVSSAS